jgi:hypothetical protein
MIPVTELDKIAQARLEDARTLLAGGRLDSAIYLCGYAVEAALKARICRTLNWPEFPSTGGEFQDYRSFQTHDLNVLLRLPGQAAKVKENHYIFWNIVGVWKVELRYNLIGTGKQAEAVAMIHAAGELLGIL